MKKVIKIIGIVLVLFFVFYWIDIRMEWNIDVLPIAFSGPGVGNSMYPTLKDGEITKWRYNLPAKENDIVTVYYNKPICGEHPGLIQKRIIKIEGRNWWVEGDNKENSCDSRNFGWIKPEDRDYYAIDQLP